MPFDDLLSLLKDRNAVTNAPSLPPSHENGVTSHLCDRFISIEGFPFLNKQADKLTMNDAARKLVTSCLDGVVIGRHQVVDVVACPTSKLTEVDDVVFIVEPNNIAMRVDELRNAVQSFAQHPLIQDFPLFASSFFGIMSFIPNVSGIMTERTQIFVQRKCSRGIILIDLMSGETIVQS